MTSQKRFRHQENSNTSARSRDLPPRFKRQKSSSGQTSLDSRTASPPSAHSENNYRSDNMTKRSQIPTSTGTTMNSGSPSQTYSVLRPVNYVYSDVPNSSVPQQVYQPMNSQQMWTAAGYTGLQPVVMSPNSMMVHPTVSQVGHLGGSTSYMNENCAPSPSFYIPQSSPMSPWNTSGYGSPYHSSCSSPAPTIPSPVPSGVEREQVKSPQPAAERIKSTASPSDQYIDPDLRTIEMLRELERVADKESQEADEGGSDRKTLVSHHLRMLMCAMDRYTENIDNEMDSSTRNDDGILTNCSNTSSPSPSPVPRKTPAQESPLKGSNGEVQPKFWNQDTILELQMQRGRPLQEMTPAPRQVQRRPPPNSTIPSRVYYQASQMPLFQDSQPSQQQMSEWNMWSGQSFDFGGVLGHPLCLNGTNEHFETFQDVCFPANKERKPLYKR